MPYNEQDMHHIAERIDNDINDFNADCIISFQDVVGAITTLKPKKNNGHFGLSTHHLINACDNYIFMCQCFSLPYRVVILPVKLAAVI